MCLIIQDLKVLGKSMLFYIVTVCDVKPLMQTSFTSREGIR